MIRSERPFEEIRELSTFRLDINVRNGIVYLKGNISSHVHERAVNLVRGVDSVAAVIDQMNVCT